MNGTDATERVIDVDGTAVRCQVAGPEDGQPLVLLHGGGMDAAAVSWGEVFPALADEYRLYAPDWPGYGESDPVPAGVTPHVDYYIDVLDELLSTLELVQATLIGISKGGGAALGYTLEQPARVARLALVDSYGLGGEVPGGKTGAAYVKAPKLLEATWWAMKRSRGVTKGAVENVTHPDSDIESLVEDAYAAVQRPNAGDAYRRFQRAEVGWSQLRTNYAARTDDLPVPTLFVHGEDDELIPVEQSKRAADAAPVADLFTLHECGHWVPRECPEAFVSRLEAWLER
jgi:pimeloyl-ACP methyl ester carboxylesterase